MLGYIRHVFLYDILNDAVEDLGSETKLLLGEKQNDVIKIFDYWFELGKLASAKNSKQKILDFCKTFNMDFCCREDTEYEISILYSANELKRFLNAKYKKIEEFDKKRLSNICSNDFFVGKLLKEFLDNLFNN